MANDDMAAGDYVQAQRTAYMVAELVRDIDFDAAVRMAARSETLGPILDPTLWIKKGPAMQQDLKVLRALADLKAALQPLYTAQAAAAAQSPIADDTSGQAGALS